MCAVQCSVLSERPPYGPMADGACPRVLHMLCCGLSAAAVAAAAVWLHARWFWEGCGQRPVVPPPWRPDHYSCRVLLVLI